MSLIDMANDLEYLSKDELISQANNPDGRYPVYLVLSEIKRRTDAEQAYMASMPAAQTTVAEEQVNKFIGAASESPMFTQTMPQGMDFSPNAAPPMTPPMQTMATGGQVKGMANGQSTYLDQYNQYLQNKAFYDAKVAKQQVPQKGYFARNYFDDDGNFRYGKAALDASIVLPFGGLAIGAGLKGLRALAGSKLGKRFLPQSPKEALQNLYSRPPDPRIGKLQPNLRTYRDKDGKLRTFEFKPNVNKDKLGRADLDSTKGQFLRDRKFSPARAAGTVGVTSLIAQSLMPDGKKPVEAEDFGDFVYTPTETADGKAAIDPNDLIKLGGLLMSSGTPKELGTGLIGYADQKALEQATASEAEMAALYDLARARKAEAETDYMPIESLTNQLDVINDAYKAAYENGDADEMRRLGGLRNQLINQLSGIQGFALQSANTYDQFATAT